LLIHPLRNSASFLADAFFWGRKSLEVPPGQRPSDSRFGEYPFCLEESLHRWLLELFSGPPPPGAVFFQSSPSGPLTLPPPRPLEVDPPLCLPTGIFFPRGCLFGSRISGRHSFACRALPPSFRPGRFIRRSTFLEDLVSKIPPFHFRRCSGTQTGDFFCCRGGRDQDFFFTLVTLAVKDRPRDFFSDVRKLLLDPP